MPATPMDGDAAARIQSAGVSRLFRVPITTSHHNQRTNRELQAPEVLVPAPNLPPLITPMRAMAVGARLVAEMLGRPMTAKSSSNCHETVTSASMGVTVMVSVRRGTHSAEAFI